jgi:hypothetical protein
MSLLRDLLCLKTIENFKSYELLSFKDILNLIVKNKDIFLKLNPNTKKQTKEEALLFIELACSVLFNKVELDFKKRTPSYSHMYEHLLNKLLNLSLIEYFLRKKCVLYTSSNINLDKFALFEDKVINKNHSDEIACFLKISLNNAEVLHELFVTTLMDNEEDFLEELINNIGNSNEFEEIQNNLIFLTYKNSGIYEQYFPESAYRTSEHNVAIAKIILKNLNIECAAEENIHKQLADEVKKVMLEFIEGKTYCPNSPIERKRAEYLFKKAYSDEYKGFLEVDEVISKLIPQHINYNLYQASLEYLSSLFFELLSKELSFKRFYKFIENEAKYSFQALNHSCHSEESVVGFVERFYRFYDSFIQHKTKEEKCFKNSSKLNMFKWIILLALKLDISFEELKGIFYKIDNNYEQTLYKVFRDAQFISLLNPFLTSNKDLSFYQALSKYNFKLYLDLLRKGEGIFVFVQNPSSFNKLFSFIETVDFQQIVKVQVLQSIFREQQQMQVEQLRNFNLVLNIVLNKLKDDNSENLFSLLRFIFNEKDFLLSTRAGEMLLKILTNFLFNYYSEKIILEVFLDYEVGFDRSLNSLLWLYMHYKRLNGTPDLIVNKVSYVMNKILSMSN